MIFDYGCLPAYDKLAHIGAAFLGCLSCLYCFAGISALGAVLRGERCYSLIDSLLGWGIVSLALTFLCVVIPQPLRDAAIGFFVLSAAAIVYQARHGYFKDPFWPFVAGTGTVFLLAINLYGIGKWDDFSHWVPNALYLWHYDGVPSHALPQPHSVWPGYPYALPFLTYLASCLAGGFLVTGGTMFNFLFLAGFGAMMPRWTATMPSRFNFSSFFALFLGLLSVTLLNPAFNASFTMTNQGDTGSMIVIGGMAVWMYQFFENKGNGFTLKATLELAILGSLLVLIKQANIGILLFLVGGFLIVAWKNRRLKDGLHVALPAFLGALAVRSLWQHDVADQMDGNGFGLQPLNAWRWDLSAALARSVAQTMVKKSGSFALIILLIILGFRALRRPASSRNNFLIVSAAAGGGYLAFLMGCYLGTSFSEREIRSAASFYRYSTHLGLLGIVLVWMLAPDVLALLKPRSSLINALHAPAARRLGVLLVFTALPATLLLAPSVLIGTPTKSLCSLRREAKEIVRHLPARNSVSIFEPDGDGFFSYVVNFQLALDDDAEHPERFARSGYNLPSAETPEERFAELDKQPDVRFIYIRKANPTVVNFAGGSNLDSSLLLTRNPSGWEATPLSW